MSEGANEIQDEREEVASPEARDRMRPDPQADLEIADRWRAASVTERGWALWGLLEFADRVQRGKDSVPEPEPLRSLPAPVGERQAR
ncbi:MAG: hypothetical protein M3355_04960 [Actinomycetota bacterium]|nr:hypothetical protein [Actinomycetota bacterium]